MLRRKLAFAVVLLCSLVALGACTAESAEEESESGQTGPIEKELTKEIEASGDYETPVVSLTCPDQSTETGATFACNGETEGGDVINVEVTITGDGSFDWKQSDAASE